ncbi:hypothetical protein RB597_005948 [Gaeumannomyces tritici]
MSPTTSAAAAPDLLPPPTLAVPAHLLPYDVPIPQYLATQPGVDELLTAAVVFDPHTDKILLVQRAASDGVPHRWETPGGSVEPAADATVLAAAARELREESGLAADAVVALVHAHEFDHGGRTFQKLTFEFEVTGLSSSSSSSALPVVTLDPAEHQDYVWASEEECRARRADGRTLVFTFPSQEAALEAAFARRKARG